MEIQHCYESNKDQHQEERQVSEIGERFAQRRGKKKESPESRLYEEIGRLKVERDFLSGKLGS